MVTVSNLAATAHLMGDPARAAMLVAMLDGRAFTAGELARTSGIAPSTASGHLAKLHDGGLISLHAQGRHRYYQLASADVGNMIERMMAVTSELAAAHALSKPIFTGPRDQALRRARVCYDHLAGEIAVGVTDQMTQRDELVMDCDGAMITPAGLALLESLGVPPGIAREKGNAHALCRPCLDWSERKPHLAGAIAAALFQRFQTLGWIKRMSQGRALEILPKGRLGFEQVFNIRP
jgi:DNA-binding transcriptional ArsR family regulator